MSVCGIFDFNNDMDKRGLEQLAKKMAGNTAMSLVVLPNFACCVDSETFVDVATNNSWVVVFYGELYNAPGGQLEQTDKFTSSKAAFILQGYEQYGGSFFSKLNGAYTCIIVNLEEKSVVFCRDKIGAKVLYYSQQGNKVLFSTTLKGMLRSGQIEKKIDHAALSQFFQLTYIPAPKSMIAGVEKVPPACSVSIKENQKTEHPYWDIQVHENEFITDYQKAKSILREKVYAAIEKRLDQKENAGVFLSGGFDSSIVLGVMSNIINRPVDAYTIGFAEKGYDESSLAAIVAKKNNAKHHIIELNEDIAVDTIETVLKEMDEPYADSSLIATYLVCKEAKAETSVALLGDAGDELFAGYNKYLVGYYNEKYNKIPKFIKKGIIKPIAKILPVRSAMGRKINKFLAIAEQDIFQQRKRLMSLGFKDFELLELMPNIPVDEISILEEYYNNLKNVDEQTKAQYLDFKVVLEGDMTRKTERAAIMAEFNTRAPLLDSEIVDFAYNIPTKFKINGKQRKIILKDAFRDLLPEQLFKAPKTGFAVPISMWFDNILKSELRKLSDREFIEAQGLFDYEYLEQTVNAHITKRENRASELWAFCVFQRWYIDNIGI